MDLKRLEGKPQKRVEFSLELIERSRNLALEARVAELEARMAELEAKVKDKAEEIAQRLTNHEFYTHDFGNGIPRD